MFRLTERLAAVSLVIMLATGAGLFLYGRTIPAYTDMEAARQLNGPDSCDANGVVDGWYEQMMALETMRYPIMQSGMSVALAAVSIFALLLLFGDKSRERMKTPSRKWTYFALGIGVISLSWFSQLQSLALDQSRGLFPWCADSIAIPMFFITEFYTALFMICVLAGAVLASQFRDLPVPLWQWRSEETAKSWLITLPFALFALLVLLLGLDGARHSSFIGTPAAIVALYLIEATRSALLAPSSRPSTAF
jgi:hypothetical protein